MEFLVLGPTEARCAGEAIPLSGARRRSLVTRLLLDVGHAVSAGTLIDDVWDDGPPAAAAATLQSHVSQLRKVLGASLERRGDGYVIRLDEASLDSAEFEAQVDGAAAHLTGGDRRAAVDSLRAALRLWRGRALQDVADRPWAQPEAARLEERRRGAVEQLLRARLEAGEHEQVVAEAERAVADEPLREHRWATLMLALYRCGRQADALRAHQRLRARLSEELGIDPSPPLMALEAAILRQDHGLQPAIPPAVSDDATDALGRARCAAAARDWPRVCELLVAADRDAPLGPDDLELLGDAAFMAGDQETSIGARQRAHALWLQGGDRARAAVDALLIVGNHYVRNRTAIAAGWFHKGRRLVEGEPQGPAHGVLAFTRALIALATGDLDGAVRAATEAQQIGSRFGDSDIEAVGLTLHAWALTRLGRLKEAQPMLDEALAWASSGQLGPIATGQIFCWTTQAMLAVADFDRAAQWIEAIASSGVEGFPGDCRVHHAELLRALGQHDRARDEARAARAEIQSVDLLHAGIAHYELGMVQLLQGELDRAERSFRHAGACGGPTQPGLALLRLARGDLAAAAASIDAALADPTLDELGRARVLPAAVQIAVAAGHETEASERAAELERIADRFPTGGLRAAAREAQAAQSRSS